MPILSMCWPLERQLIVRRRTDIERTGRNVLIKIKSGTCIFRLDSQKFQKKRQKKKVE
jgi:hypothetical protein